MKASIAAADSVWRGTPTEVGWGTCQYKSRDNGTSYIWEGRDK